MMHWYQYIYLIVAVWLAGCATQPKWAAVEQAQRDVDTSIAQQSQIIQLQQGRIAELESTQSALISEIVELKDELEQVQSRLVERRTAAATASASQSAAGSGNPSTQEEGEVDPTGKVILGQKEWVWFDLIDRDIPIHVDTGTKISTLFVQSAQPFERDGKGWVRFTLSAAEETEYPDDEITSAAPVVRTVKTRGTGDSEKRPVVKLKIKVGPLVESVEFALVERNEAKHLGLLGRNFLRDIAVVDVARQYVQPKHVNGKP